jgi:hypothetical protein
VTQVLDFQRSKSLNIKNFIDVESKGQLAGTFYSDASYFSLDKTLLEVDQKINHSLAGNVNYLLIGQLGGLPEKLLLALVPPD